MLHFFLIAALIFGLYSVVQSSNENILEIEQSDIDVRIFQAEVARGEELTEDQRQLIAARYIEEQILVREALSMELDKDARIHDILAQKMRHVLSGDIIQPSDEELNAYYQENQQRYRTTETITVDELVFDNKDTKGKLLIDPDEKEKIMNNFKEEDVIEIHHESIAEENRLFFIKKISMVGNKILWIEET